MRLHRFLAAIALVLASTTAAAMVPSPRFDQLEARLKIRPEQKEQFEMAVGATKRALLAVALTMMEAKQRLADELMKPSPDFSRLFDGFERNIDLHLPLFKEAGREWEKLFGMLDEEQIRIARQFLQENLGRALSQAIPEVRPVPPSQPAPIPERI